MLQKLTFLRKGRRPLLDLTSQNLTSAFSISQAATSSLITTLAAQQCIGLASCFTVGTADFSMMFDEMTSHRSCCCKKKQLGVQISFILTYSLLFCIRGSCSKGHIQFHTALNLTECQGQPMLHQKVLPVISFRWHSNEERQSLKQQFSNIL